MYLHGKYSGDMYCPVLLCIYVSCNIHMKQVGLGEGEEGFLKLNGELEFSRAMAGWCGEEEEWRRGVGR